MLAKVYTCAVVGLDGELVEVEVDISPGLPRFNVVGLSDAAVQEARERVRAAVGWHACPCAGQRQSTHAGGEAIGAFEEEELKALDLVLFIADAEPVRLWPVADTQPPTEG